MNWTKGDLQQERKNIGIHLLSKATIWRGYLEERSSTEVEKEEVLIQTVKGGNESVDDLQQSEDFHPTPLFQPRKKSIVDFSLTKSTGWSVF